MKLDRNINPSGKGKYALVNLRKIPGNPQTAVDLAAAILINPESAEFGRVGDQDEFWLLKLKDKYAAVALSAYAVAAAVDDPEYAQQVRELVSRAGPSSRFCKAPD